MKSASMRQTEKRRFFDEISVFLSIAIGLTKSFARYKVIRNETNEVFFVKRLTLRRNTLMTEGPIWKHILNFALPLLIGNIFQQLYNTVDSIVVGNFVSTQALAAVGATGMIINTLVGFFMGLSIGATVIISQFFGARDENAVHRAVSTTILLTFALGVVLTAVGVSFVPFMLRFMKTPEDVMPDATQYLRIYFGGIITLMVYNMGSGILRAVGDSRRPLYFLIFSACTNIVLDLLFVLAFRMGVAGVALATVISQLLSAILVLFVLSRSTDCYRLVWSDMKPDWQILGKIFSIGMPAAIQSAITSFSNVFVQSYINHFGSACMAGYTSYGKIDQLVMLPMQSISQASTTFVGQNLGADQLERSKKGVTISIWIAIGITAFLTILLNLFAKPLLSMFSPEEDVLYFGVEFIRVQSPFYVLCVLNQIYAGALRGAGDSKAPMFIMLGSFVVFRQIYLYVGTLIFPESLIFVALGYPAGWLLCSTLEMIHYKRGKWEKNYRRLRELRQKA